MSQATSLRGQVYENSIRSGFLEQNRNIMHGGEFEIACKTIMESCKHPNGTIGLRTYTDIDAQFVATSDFVLREVLPVGCFCHEPEFQVTAGTHVQLECSTTEGANLTKSENTYMSRKVMEHAGLVFRTDLIDYQSEPGADYVLIFVFNGADHVKVHHQFKALCTAQGVRGTTVFMPSDIANTWAVTVQYNAVTVKYNATRFAVCRTMLQQGMGHRIPDLVQGMTEELAVNEWGHAALGLPEPEAGL